MLKNSLKQRVIRDHVSIDGVIANVTNAANGSIAYTYFDLGADGFDQFTLDHILTATTLTIESTNVPTPESGGLAAEAEITCSSTDGAGATLVASTVRTALGFNVDDDLIGIMVEITADATTPTNVGQQRLITDYAQASGTLTLSAALPGATTNNVTKFKLLDNPQVGGRLVSDPPGGDWRDVTTSLTGASTHTTSGRWTVDTPQKTSRFRIKQERTNATNACKLILARGR